MRYHIVPEKHRANLKMFKADLPSGLDVVREMEFASERQMQRFVESNIGTLFPGLVFLTTEFGKSDGGKFRPDTIAFDETNRTFVVIEYKNKLNEGVMDQAKSYLNYMRQNRYVLESLYRERGPASRVLFNWGAMYAIVVAPEFSERQIEGNKTDPGLELHEIRCYDGHAVTMKHVGGAHESVTPRSKTASGDTRQGDPSKPGHPSGDEALERFRKRQLSDKTRQLFDYVDKSLRDRLGLEPNAEKHYVKYMADPKSVICSVARGKTSMNLHYNVKAEENVLGVFDSVRDVSKIGHDGVGHYESKIRTTQDFEQIVPLIKRVIRHKKGRQ